jgi:hypothetical protein
MRDFKHSLVGAKVVRPNCQCGATMWLSAIEPTDDPDWDLRTFVSGQKFSNEDYRAIGEFECVVVSVFNVSVNLSEASDTSRRYL